jgi:hypothetical protein
LKQGDHAHPDAPEPCRVVHAEKEARLERIGATARTPTHTHMD